MSNKEAILSLAALFFLFVSLFFPIAWSEPIGQTIQIYTRLHSFIGRPSWLLVIRDLDHGQNIPYVFDITKGQDFWMAVTNSKNYLILASTLKISTYGSQHNRYQQHTIHNFCGLESGGQIMHQTSLSVSITGNLTFNANTINCQIARFIDSN